MALNPLRSRPSVEIPDRPKPTKAQKAEAWGRENGLCPLCLKPVARDGMDVQWDHRIARGLTGDDSTENLFATHVKCHSDKTRGPDGDIARVAKAKRQEKLTGPKVRKAGGFRGWRRFDGTIVRKGHQ